MNTLEQIVDEARDANRKAEIDAKTAHLPGDWPTALEFYRNLTLSFNDAMLAGDVPETERLYNEAHDLAVKLNGGDGGIVAHADAPAYVLMRETAAPKGTVPLWGQEGNFYIRHRGVLIRIEWHGMLYMSCGGFAAHAVKKDKPFISDTGYRSFLGHGGMPKSGTVLDYVSSIIEDHICNHLKGRLETIKPIKAVK
jgi:hypothetical protein